jgi:3,4-dihydroxy 2-butanone 4-phosphate synthase
MSWTSEEPAGRSGSAETADDVEAAVRAIRDGGPVCVHDAADREGEVDLVYPADSVTPEAVARMRNDAGGLICVALSHVVADALDLPFLADAVDHPTTGDSDLSYDDRSSFSITVNHREVRTGITDDDRARTIAALGAASVDPDPDAFSETFRSPGHVHLLRGHADGLAGRRGHTELALALADAADAPPAMVVCEMLDDASGEALAPAAGRAYADRHEIPYVEGRRLAAALA